MESAERIALSYRKALEIEIARWDGFRRALRGREVETFDKMMNHCRMHASAGDKASKTLHNRSHVHVHPAQPTERTHRNRKKAQAT
jgi:hypothetical protein